MKRMFLLAVLITALAGALPASARGNAPARTATPIKHLINVMQENHSFDNYFGTYPGVDGIPAGVCVPVNPFDKHDRRCVRPFHIGDNDVQPADLDHSAATNRLQLDGGALDGFVYALNQRGQDGRLAMGYYDGRDLPYYWEMARQYVLFDRFFSSDHSGSDENHMYWVTGTAGEHRGPLPTEGYGNLPTIFDRLEAKGVSWKFYVQNYDPKITYRAKGELGNRESQVIWVPLLKYARYVDDPKLSSHIVDLGQYYKDLQDGTLPAVAYIVPSGASEHPPSSIMSGQRFVNSLLRALMQSDYWKDSAFLLNYDDWGGWYDHVNPPQVDKHGYGFRTPALLISAYAKRGYIDHTQLDYTSILKFIEHNWGLEPLASRDARANNFLDAFDFSQPPRSPQLISPEFRTPTQPQARRWVLYGAYGTAWSLGGLIIGWELFRSTRSRVRSRGGG